MIRPRQKSVLIQISRVSLEELELGEGMNDGSRRERKKICDTPAAKNIKSLRYIIHNDDAIDRIMGELEQLGGYGFSASRRGNEIYVTFCLTSLGSATRRIKRLVRKTKDVQAAGRRSPIAYFRQYQTTGTHRAV